MFKSKKLKKWTSWVATLVLTLSILLPTSVVKVKATEAKDLVDKSNKINIISFNDLHGSVKQDGKNSGIAKLAGAINAYKAANIDTIVVSGGDNFQGSSMSNLTYGAPVNEFLKSIGIVASAVGNHEFDWGIDRIANWSKEGGYDFLACNVYDKTTKKPVDWAKPYKIVEVSGVNIALIGFSTPETEFKTNPEIVKNLEFKAPKEVAKEWIDKAKAEGANVVIALTHLGSLQDSKTGVITGEAADLCNDVKGLDAVISAHTHSAVSGKVNGVPIIQGYYNGRDLGVLSIMLDKDGKVISVEPSVDELYKRPTTLTDDVPVKAIFDKYDTELKPILDEVVAKTAIDLEHDRFKYAGTSPLGYWTCDVMRKAANTEIGITNGGGLRCPIPKGDITMGKLYEVMPFDNTLYKMELKGSDLKRVIENGIMNDSIGWVQVAGVKINYDSTKATGNRITSMTLEDGTKVNTDKYYTVVTNDFMAAGGDKYDFTGSKNMVDTNIPIRNAMVDALKALNGKDLDLLFAQPLENINSAPAVPSISEYIVKAGDCLWKIASKFNTTYQEIAEYNKIKNVNLIFIGQKLLIPIPAK